MLVWEYEGGFLAYPQEGSRLYRLNMVAAEFLPTQPNEADLAAMIATPPPGASVEAIPLDAYAALLPLWFLQDVPPPETAQAT